MAVTGAQPRYGIEYEHDRDGGEMQPPGHGPVSEAVQEFFESLGQSSRQLAEAAERFAVESLQAGERLRDDMMNRIEEALQRLDASVSASKEAATQAREAAQAAQDAASEATRQAERAAGERAATPDAHALLQQLETDYSNLSALVQDLQQRITTLGEVAGAASLPEEAGLETVESVAAATPSEEEAPAWQPPPEPEATTAAVEPVAEAPVQLEPAATAEPAPGAEPAFEAIEAPVLQPEPEAPGEPEPAAVEVSGRILVTLAPVPDFDLLLKLDAALGRMASVGNVSLADYVSESATFRIQLRETLPAEDFSRRLIEAAGLRLTLTRAAPTELRFIVGD
jgi:hypothetical protein